MPINKMLLVTGIALLMQSFALIGEERNAECPKNIETKQVLASSVSSGWSNFNLAGSQPLIGVSFFFDSPDKQNLLAPTIEKQENKKIIAAWTFPKSGADYWIACEYAKTMVVVAKKLRSGVNTCTVEYDVSFSTPVVQSWSCR